MAPIFTGNKFGFGAIPPSVATSPYYIDPDAANLLFAYSFDNTNQVNDVQNIIRANAGVSSGTLINATKGSAASFSTTQKKFYTHSLYSGNNYTNGNVYIAKSASTYIHRLQVPFTVQFWANYPNGINNSFPSVWWGDMGNFYEPGSGRSGWRLGISPNNYVEIIGYYSGDSTRGVRSNTFTLSNGAWYHFAVAVSGGGTASRVYINGVLQTNNNDTISSQSVGAQMNDSPSTVTYVAGRGNYYAYDGRNDFADAYYQDIKWYNIARSGANIIAEYNQGLPIIEA